MIGQYLRKQFWICGLNINVLIWTNGERMTQKAKLFQLHYLIWNIETFSEKYTSDDRFWMWLLSKADIVVFYFLTICLNFSALYIFFCTLHNMGCPKRKWWYEYVSAFFLFPYKLSFLQIIFKCFFFSKERKFSQSVKVIETDKIDTFSENL